MGAGGLWAWSQALRLPGGLGACPSGLVGGRAPSPQLASLSAACCLSFRPFPSCRGLSWDLMAPRDMWPRVWAHADGGFMLPPPPTKPAQRSSGSDILCAAVFLVPRTRVGGCGVPCLGASARVGIAVSSKVPECSWGSEGPCDWHRVPGMTRGLGRPGWSPSVHPGVSTAVTSGPVAGSASTPGRSWLSGWASWSW